MVLTTFFETIVKHLIKQRVAGIAPVIGCLISFEFGYCYNKECNLLHFESYAHSSCDRFDRGKTFLTLVRMERFDWGIINGRTLTGHAHGNSFFFDCLLVGM